jgi:hypothetical protein
MGHSGAVSGAVAAKRRDRLARWWWGHRVLGAFGAIVVLAPAVAVVHRLAAGWWFSHSQAVTFTPTSPWTTQQTAFTSDGSFSISTALGTYGSTCFRIEASPPPFPGYASEGYDHQCSLLGRQGISHLDILIAVGSTFQPVYGLYVAAVSPDVTSVSLDVRTAAYDPETSDYTSASFVARRAQGIALITYPAGDSPLSVTMGTTNGRTEECSALTIQPMFLAQC